MSDGLSDCFGGDRTGKLLDDIDAEIKLRVKLERRIKALESEMKKFIEKYEHHCACDDLEFECDNIINFGVGMFKELLKQQ